MKTFDKLNDIKEIEKLIALIKSAPSGSTFKERIKLYEVLGTLQGVLEWRLLNLKTK